MTHPLVTQLRFTRSEWARGLKSVTADEGARRFGPINPIAWMVGHLAWQEQLYWLERAQDRTVVPEVKQFGYGKPLTVPPLDEAWTWWRAVTTAADPYLEVWPDPSSRDGGNAKARTRRPGRSSIAPPITTGSISVSRRRSDRSRTFEAALVRWRFREIPIPAGALTQRRWRRTRPWRKVDRGRRRHPGRRGLRRGPAAPHARDRNFLSLDRDDKFIVIGTKGFGKTLLLKAKRILHQRKTRAVCLPTSNLLDKPIGDKIFGKDALAFFARLVAAVVEDLADGDRGGDAEASRPDRRAQVNPRLARCSPTRSSAASSTTSCTCSTSRRATCSAWRNDTDGHLVPRLRAVNTPVAIFIDSVDEYFNKHIEAVRNRASDTGELSPDIWYFAQMGLVEVAYQLRRINHHLKVFAAVRKEAYARLADHVMAQQYRGSAVDIVYPVESLREIFVNNIRLEKPDAMVRPERLRADPHRGVPGPDERDPRLHRSRGGRLRLRVPAHAAPPSRPDDARRAAGGPPPRRAAPRAPPEGGREPGGDRDRPGVPRRDRALRGGPGPGPGLTPAARPHPDPRRGRVAVPGAHRDDRRRRAPARLLRPLPGRTARLPAARSGPRRDRCSGSCGPARARSSRMACSPGRRTIWCIRCSRK